MIMRCFKFHTFTLVKKILGGVFLLALFDMSVAQTSVSASSKASTLLAMPPEMSTELRAPPEIQDFC
jgi:hypothetical protein